MKLKIWEIALAFAVILTLFTGIGAGERARELSGKLIRLHVVANSDSEEDQSMKLLVRDAVLDRLRPALRGVGDVEEAKRVVSASLGELERTAEKVCGRDVAVTLATESFPTTEYGTFALPAGRYLSLRLKIGSAAGHNWWCVVFPPICDSGELTPETAAAIGLTDDDISLITEDSPGYVVRFRIIELWEKFLELFR